MRVKSPHMGAEKLFLLAMSLKDGRPSVVASFPNGQGRERHIGSVGSDGPGVRTLYIEKRQLPAEFYDKARNNIPLLVSRVGLDKYACLEYQHNGKPYLVVSCSLGVRDDSDEEGGTIIIPNQRTPNRTRVSLI